MNIMGVHTYTLCRLIVILWMTSHTNGECNNLYNIVLWVTSQSNGEYKMFILNVVEIYERYIDTCMCNYS